MDFSIRGEETTNDTIRHYGGAIPEVQQARSGLDTNHMKSHTTVRHTIGDPRVTVSSSLVGKTDATVPKKLHCGELLLVHRMEELRKDSGGATLW